MCEKPGNKRAKFSLPQRLKNICFFPTSLEPQEKILIIFTIIVFILKQYNLKGLHSGPFTRISPTIKQFVNSENFYSYLRQKSR